MERHRKTFELSAINEDSSVEEIQEMMWAMVQESKNKLRFVASSNLEDYLNGRLVKKWMSPRWLKKSRKVRDAEKTNRLRFQVDLLHEISKMSDGKKDFETHYDRLIKYLGTWSMDELFYASGSSTLTTFGKFTLEKKERRVSIKGKLDHKWRDTYDWHTGAKTFVPGFGVIADEAIKKLERFGGARPYKLYSHWSESTDVEFHTWSPSWRWR